MNQMIFSPNISRADAIASAASIELLRPYLVSGDRALVFFVGAGASMAGNTGMPGTPSLLYHLLVQALSQSGKPDLQSDALQATLKEISARIGFEITLNDFWQICRQATALLYESFADLERKCISNRVHTFLAHWLATGGTVITTNYDRLIEREWWKSAGPIRSRYREEGSDSFASWKEDFKKSGVLFKIHGSLDDPESCLGALEHVGTRLSGYRAELLEEIVRTRPLCFVGWQGVDPDIPALLNDKNGDRNPSLPTFWIHYEVDPSSPISLKDAIANCSPLIKPYAENKPILTEADRVFGKFLEWVGLPLTPNPMRPTELLDFSKAVSNCTPTGLTRMVGITLRRAKKYEEAGKVLKVALDVAVTPGERNAALQEIALLQQQITGKDTDKAKALLEQARKTLKEEPDLWLQLNTDFGLLSMSIVALKKRPWLLLKIPGLFHKYRQDIETLQRETADKESVALHKSLLQLYSGRLRLKLLSWIGVFIRPLADWILQPFEVAYSKIEEAKDIHLHSRIDVLAYRAIALAHLKRCQEAQHDIPEIHRLIAILNDDARTQHWKKQVEEIKRYCNQA